MEFKSREEGGEEGGEDRNSFMEVEWQEFSFDVIPPAHSCAKGPLAFAGCLALMIEEFHCGQHAQQPEDLLE